MKLPKLTTKQAEILRLLYTYRYLDRVQIQAFLGHKDKRRIASWLKDLREKHYVEWIYSTDFIEKTKPAIYYLGINGIRYLKTVQTVDGTAYYPLEEIRKRYKDSQRSRTFIDRSLLVSTCCVTLEQSNATQDRTTKRSYTSITEADYIDPYHGYHFLAEHDVLRPNLCIIKQTGRTTTNYLLEIFDATLPRYRLRYRLKQYVAYLDDSEWEGNEPEPIILLACATLTDLIYAKRAIKRLLEDSYEDDLHIRFTTSEQLRLHGITARIWEEGRKQYGL